jgi:hypothetical protein
MKRWIFLAVLALCLVLIALTVQGIISVPFLHKR